MPMPPRFMTCGFKVRYLLAQNVGKVSTYGIKTPVADFSAFSQMINLQKFDSRPACEMGRAA